MIGLDTNVLLRVVVEDPEEPDQTAAARRLVRRHAAEGLFVGVPVLLEVVWVLQRRFRLSRDVLHTVLVALLDQSAFVIGDREVVAHAVSAFARSGRVGFADCLIEAFAAAAGARTTVTFDADAASRPHFTLLTV